MSVTNFVSDGSEKQQKRRYDLAERNPFADMEALRQEIDRAFEGFGRAPTQRVVFLPRDRCAYRQL
jgi:hypothetical protein